MKYRTLCKSHFYLDVKNDAYSVICFCAMLYIIQTW